MGSVSISRSRLSLPARLGHAGNVPLVRGLPQADPAKAELAVIGARPTAAAAAVVLAGLELGLAALLHLQRSLSHSPDSPPQRPARRPRPASPRPRPPRAARAWRRPRGSLP